jgi:hypothetical protein
MGDASFAAAAPRAVGLICHTYKQAAPSPIAFICAHKHLGGTALAGSPDEFVHLIADNPKNRAKVASLVGIKVER